MSLEQVLAWLVTILLSIGGVGAFVIFRINKIKASLDDLDVLTTEILDVAEAIFNAASDRVLTPEEIAAIVAQAKETEQPLRDFINSLRAIFQRAQAVKQGVKK